MPIFRLDFTAPTLNEIYSSAVTKLEKGHVELATTWYPATDIFNNKL